MTWQITYSAVEAQVWEGKGQLRRWQSRTEIFWALWGELFLVLKISDVFILSEVEVHGQGYAEAFWEQLTRFSVGISRTVLSWVLTDLGATGSPWCLTQINSLPRQKIKELFQGMTAEKGIAFSCLLITCQTFSIRCKTSWIIQLMNVLLLEQISDQPKLSQETIWALAIIWKCNTPSKWQDQGSLISSGSLEFRNEVVHRWLYSFRNCIMALKLLKLGVLEESWLICKMYDLVACKHKVENGAGNVTLAGQIKERTQLNSVLWRHHWSVWLRSWGFFLPENWWLWLPTDTVVI